MRKIEFKDIVDIADYERKRKTFRAQIMEIKNQRRLHVGPKVTYLFENFDTMLYQIQEMTRAERIVDEEGIMQEIRAYNELIPDENQISASMLIEIDDTDERKEFLTRIVDLPSYTYLTVNEEKIIPWFDPRQGTDDKLSSVQYVKFQLNEKLVDKIGESKSRMVFGFNHPRYRYEYELSPEQKKILYQDLTSG